MTISHHNRSTRTDTCRFLSPPPASPSTAFLGSEFPELDHEWNVSMRMPRKCSWKGTFEPALALALAETREVICHNI
ncbi:hypothetical protein ACOSQ3_025464 [Xanthoceras sorbifolium]